MKTKSPFLRQLGNVIKIGAQSYPIVSLEDAVLVWRDIKAKRENVTGAVYQPVIRVAFEGELYRMTYNGRVWTIPDGVEVPIGGRKTAAQHEAEGWKDFVCKS